MQEVDLKYPTAVAVQDAGSIEAHYKRVVMDHTELITRVAKTEDRLRILMCAVGSNVLMLGGVALMCWMNHG